MSEPRYRFGEFTFDAQRGVLQRNGTRVALPNKASELLALLLREAGNTVPKERLYEAIWGEKIVEDGNLTQTVYVLRRTLSNGAGERTMIRTIPQVGYAFVEPVTTEDNAAHGSPVLRYAAIAAIAVLALLAYATYARLNSAASANPEALLPTAALKAYELGRQAWNKPTRASALRAREQFLKVVKLAPKSALGYAGLSDAYLLLWGRSKDKAERELNHRMTQTYARRALDADPNSSEAHASNAQIIYYDMRPGAQQEFEHAIALNPRNALAHRWFGEYWMMNGAFSEAADELGRSNAIQPLVPQDLFWLGVAHYYAHHYSAAVEAFTEALAAGADDPQVGLHLALADEAAGDTRAALRQLDRMERVGRDVTNVRAVRASILARHGESTAALREIAPLMRPQNSAAAGTVSVAIALAAAGKPAEARAWLRAHRRIPDETSIFPSHDPRLVGLQHFEPLPPSSV
jgi:DNA-binding winged helix-turn-helix (wHTH) protein/Tfp pilus assembly protein PilF